MDSHNLNVNQIVENIMREIDNTKKQTDELTVETDGSEFDDLPELEINSPIHKTEKDSSEIYQDEIEKIVPVLSEAFSKISQTFFKDTDESKKDESDESKKDTDESKKDTDESKKDESDESKKGPENDEYLLKITEMIMNLIEQSESLKEYAEIVKKSKLSSQDILTQFLKGFVHGTNLVTKDLENKYPVTPKCTCNTRCAKLMRSDLLNQVQNERYLHNVQMERMGLAIADLARSNMNL